jgi:CheY-like chemotaxis protein
VWIENAEGRAALLKPTGSSEPSSARLLRSHPAVAEPKRILVIDDEPVVRRVLHDVLASEGYLVTEACDGSQGLECLLVGCPDVVVLDLMMPVMNGWAFAEECRRMGKGRDVPIIALSAHI